MYRIQTIALYPWPPQSHVHLKLWPAFSPSPGVPKFNYSVIVPYLVRHWRKELKKKLQNSKLQWCGVNVSFSKGRNRNRKKQKKDFRKDWNPRKQMLEPGTPHLASWTTVAHDNPGIGKPFLCSLLPTVYIVMELGLALLTVLSLHVFLPMFLVSLTAFYAFDSRVMQ